MKTASLFFASLLVINSSALLFAHIAYVDNVVLTGHVLTKTAGSDVHFNIKLYPPKSSNRAVLVTTTDGAGNFRFSGLSPSSYLLEVYLGTEMVNQQVIAIDGNKEITINLR